jgi:hypothetical protein
MNNPSRSHDFLWLGLALLPLIALSFLFPVQPQDYWWLLRVGQDTIRDGAVPVADAISLSRAGVPIVYQPWLAGVLYWLVNELGGVSALFLLRAALLAAAYGMVWFLAREGSGPWPATLLVIVLGLASANNWSMRAQLFGYPLFALCLWSLRHWQKGDNSLLWVLPTVMLFWVNLHGSFVLPLILAVTALIFGEGHRKPLLITLLFMLAVTLVNPRGPGVWGYFQFMLNSPSDQFFAFEWAPPRNEGWQMNIFFAWTILFAPLAAVSPRRLSVLEWVWFLGFGWLALTGLRYVIWFLFIITILTSILLAEWTGRLPPLRSVHPTVDLGFGVLMMGLALIFVPGLREHWMGDTIPVYERETTPLAATRWLEARPDLRGPLWADYAFGGYLSFNLQSRPPWMDSRFNAFPPEQWAEYVRVSRAEGWREVFDREGINLLMLSVESQPRLIEAVSSSEGWCREYQDEHALIFSRCDPLP